MKRRVRHPVHGLGEVTIPPGLSVKRRRPRAGEAGWWVFERQSEREWLADLVAGRHDAETVGAVAKTPGGYGWSATGDEPARQWHPQGDLIPVTVVYKPTRHIVTITLEMEGDRDDIDRAVKTALDNGSVQSQILELEEDLDLGPYSIIDIRHEVRS